MELLIDQEFRALIPPLAPEELAMLEQSIIEEGVRDAIITWNGYIVDGHNRYDIITKHNLTDYRVIQKQFKDKDEAKIWIIQNQFGRRNISDYTRCRLALELEQLFAAKAKENQLSTLKQNKNTVLPTLAERIDTRESLAKIAHVSHGTIDKVRKIEDKATPEQKARLEAGTTTINRVFNQIRRDTKEWQQPTINIQPKTNIVLQIGDMTDIVPGLGLFDLIIADPPYNRTRWDWDSYKDKEFLKSTRSWLTICKQALKPEYHLFWFCSPFYSADIEMIFRELSLPIQSRIIWHRRNMSMGSDAKDKFIDTWEMVFHSGNHPLNFNGQWDDARFDVQIHAAPQSNFKDAKIHPTQKPSELIKVFVEFGSKSGDRILDPFAGSGVTGLVAEGRECVLVERDIEYGNTIKSRFQL